MHQLCYMTAVLRLVIFTLVAWKSDGAKNPDLVTELEARDLDFDVNSDFQCSENDLKSPSLFLLRDGKEIPFENGSNMFFPPPRFGAQNTYIGVLCRAPFPVLIKRSEPYRYDVDKFHVYYQDFQNLSSYTFEQVLSFDYAYIELHGFVLECVPVSPPYAPAGDNDKRRCQTSTKVMLFKLDVPKQGNSGYNADTEADTEIQPEFSHSIKVERDGAKSNNTREIVPLPLSIIYDHAFELNTSLCDVVFYYKETDWDFSPKFVFSCQFLEGAKNEGKNSSVGDISSIECRSKSRCDQLFQNRRKLQICWRLVDGVAGKNCPNCPEIEIQGASIISKTTESQALVCRRRPEEISPFNEEEEEEEVTQKYSTIADEVALAEAENDGMNVAGTSVAFSIPYGLLTRRAAIYFPNDPYDEGQPYEKWREMAVRVNLRKFDAVQLLDSTLEVECAASRYLISASQFQLALEFTTGNESTLHFLPLEPFKDKKVSPLTQTFVTRVHLNDTRITRIFCFAHIQNTYQWINASQSLHILDSEEFLRPRAGKIKCNELDVDVARNRTPTIAIRDENGILAWHENWDNILELGSKDHYVEVFCTANEPVRLRYQQNQNKTDMTAIFNDGSLGNFCSKTPVDVLFKLLKYATIEHFQFRNLGEKLLFRCELASNPCIHSMLEVSPVQEIKLDVSGPSLSLHLNPANFSVNIIHGIDKPLDVPLPEYQHCEAIFYYRKLTKFPGYELTCQFPIRRNGAVNYHFCDSPTKCRQLYENRRLPKECFKSVDSWEFCPICKPKKIRGYKPFVVTCTQGQRGGEDFEETSLGSFAFFDVPTEENPIPNIYFDDKIVERNPELMVSVEKFDPYQAVNASLRVICRVSAYFMSEHIALAYKRDWTEKLEDIYTGGCPELNEVLHLWTVEKVLNFREYTDKVGILCLAKSHPGVNITANVKAPLYVQALMTPTVQIETEDKNGLGQKITDHTLEADLKNQSISCHAFGYPPPAITWKTPTTVTTSDITTRQINVTYVVSRLTFGLVHTGLEGKYLCVARNKVGEDFDTVALKVSESRREKAKRQATQGIISTVAILSIAVLFAGILLWRRNRKLANTLRNLKEEEIRDFLHGDQTISESDSGFFDSAGNDKIYTHVLSLPYDTRLEVSRDDLEIDESQVLGSGQFGIVYQGWIKSPKQKGEKKVVAVKMSKSTVTVETFKEFLLEVKIMMYIGAHENVVQLLNVCTENIRERQILAAMEICGKGDLRKFLLRNKTNFKNIFEEVDLVDGYSGVDAIQEFALTTMELFNFSRGIAAGMDFLSTKMTIHGDLAARNILITEDLTPKISDFGFSRQLRSNMLYVRDNFTVIPWRWTSVEALRDKRYSIKSDVWSFGVVLYEIFSLAEEPYKDSHPELSARFLLDLQNGHRLEKPPFANDDIYALMLNCWEMEPNDRPSFIQLHQQIERLIKQLHNFKCQNIEDDKNTEEEECTSVSSENSQ